MPLLAPSVFFSLFFREPFPFLSRINLFCYISSLEIFPQEPPFFVSFCSPDFPLTRRTSNFDRLLLASFEFSPRDEALFIEIFLFPLSLQDSLPIAPTSLCQESLFQGSDRCLYFRKFFSSPITSRDPQNSNPADSLDPPKP